MLSILGDALERHQVKIHEARPQSNIKLEKKLMEDEFLYYWYVIIVMSLLIIHYWYAIIDMPLLIIHY